MTWVMKIFFLLRVLLWNGYMNNYVVSSLFCYGFKLWVNKQTNNKKKRKVGIIWFCYKVLHCRKCNFSILENVAKKKLSYVWELSNHRTDVIMKVVFAVAFRSVRVQVYLIAVNCGWDIGRGNWLYMNINLCLPGVIWNSIVNQWHFLGMKDLFKISTSVVVSVL